MSFPIPKPNWKDFQDDILSSINSSREWRKRLSECGNKESKFAYGECKSELENLYHQLVGIRKTISLLYGNDVRVQRLIGFISFAEISENNHEEFLTNIRAEIKDLIDERL